MSCDVKAMLDEVGALKFNTILQGTPVDGFKKDDHHRMLKAQIRPSFSASNALLRSSNFPSSTSRRLASSSLFRWAIGSL